MTAPTGDDALREAMRDVLAARHSCDTLLSSFICNQCRRSVDALLPVVLRYGRDKAAEDLDSAARVFDGSDKPAAHVVKYLRAVARQRRARAAALTDDDPRLGFPTTGRPWT